MTASITVANKLLDALLGDVDMLGSSVEVALSTTDPTSSLTEPTVGGYQRLQVANNPTVWPAAASGAKTNGTVLVYPEASADYPQVGWVAIMAGAEIALHGPLDAPVTVASGSTPRFVAGALRLTLA